MLRKNCSRKPCPGGATPLPSCMLPPGNVPFYLSDGSTGVVLQGSRKGDPQGRLCKGQSRSWHGALGAQGKELSVAQVVWLGVHVFGRECQEQMAPQGGRAEKGTVQGFLQKGSTWQKLIIRLWLQREMKRKRAWDRERGGREGPCSNWWINFHWLPWSFWLIAITWKWIGEGKWPCHWGCIWLLRQSVLGEDTCVVSRKTLSQQKAPVCHSDTAC